MNMNIKWISTKGVCDGNHFAAHGLPCVDTMGIVGGNLHSKGEYCMIDSINTRVQLAINTIIALSLGKNDHHNRNDSKRS